MCIRVSDLHFEAGLVCQRNCLDSKTVQMPKKREKAGIIDSFSGAKLTGRQSYIVVAGLLLLPVMCGL